MSDNQDKLIEKLTDVMNSISLDIREIKTNLKHFNEKFSEVQKEQSNFRVKIGESKHEIESLKIVIAKQELKIEENKEDIERLFEKNREKDIEDKGTKRWITTTTISSGIAIAGLLITVIFKLIEM